MPFDEGSNVNDTYSGRMHVGTARFAETLDASVSRESSGEGMHGYGHARAGAILTKGAQMGRYVILRTLGIGAMGTVYHCYDPELDRKVALKLLRGGTSFARRRALLREAQAMAKLTHPNVVTVYDVGEHDGQVYVAMELVEGTTLRRWLGERPRNWRDVLETFVMAGRGLRAAHARGLIHRDFKPDNVMVSPDGQVRVMDFGLARGGADSDHEDEDEDIRTISGSLMTEATVGRIAGTPAYMAPEQAVASDLSPSVDQFAFCVSLWEGVAGQRPFDGHCCGERFTNVVEGRVTPIPASVRMPGWLKRVLLRGLQPTTTDRWASMEELLTALERGRQRWRWQVALGIIAFIALPIAVLVAQHQRQDREHRELVAECEVAGAAIDEIWNDAARDRLRSGLLSTGVDFAEDSVETLIPWLDEYQRTWSSGRSQACLHRSVHRDWTAEQLDRSAWCFEDRRLQLEATVDQIAGGDARAARRAVRLASYLDPVDACLDPDLLERLPAPPAEKRDEIRSVRATLIASDKLRHGGMSADALELAQDARLRAQALGWPPLLASARFIEGRCMLEGGRFVEADASLTHAYFEAQDAGSAEVAFRAARSLVRAHTRLRRYADAEVWARHADVLAAKMADPGGLDEAEGHFLLLEVYLGLGDYDVAAEHGDRAFAKRALALGPDHPITASVLRSLGRVYLAQGRPREASEAFERSFHVWEAAVGHDHPHVGELLMLRGSALLAMGSPEKALPLVQEGLAVHETTLSADHPKLVADLDELNKVLTALGRLDAAEHVQQRSTAICRGELPVASGQDPAP